MHLIHGYILFQTIIQNYFIILFGNVQQKSISKICQVLPLNIKSICPTQKSPLIIESQSCILKIVVTIFLLPINFLFSFEMCSTPKLSNYVILLLFTSKGIQWVLINFYSSKFTSAHPPLCLVNYCVNRHLWICIHVSNTFVFPN